MSTKLVKEVDELLHSHDVDIEQLEVIANQLEEKIRTLNEIDKEILGMCKVSKIEYKIEKVKRNDRSHRTVVNTNKVSLPIASMLTINPSQGTVENTSANSRTMNTTMSLPKLPKLEDVKFRGQVTEWSSFWDSCNSAIHSNTNISKVNKFNYLHSLLDAFNKGPHFDKCQSWHS